MRHNQLTVVAPLAEHKQKALAGYLEKEVGYQCAGKPANALLREIAELHFLSMFTFVSPGEACNPEGYLVIEASFDGPVDAFLQVFTTKFTPLNDILDHCKRLPNEGAVEFIRRHSYKPGCFYVSCPGLTRPQIENERRLLELLQAESAAMGEGAAAYGDNDRVVQRIRDVARQNGFLTPRAAPEPFLVRYGPSILTAIGVLLLAIVVLAIPWPLLVLLGLAVFHLVYHYAPEKLYRTFGDAPPKSKSVSLSLGVLALLAIGAVAALIIYLPAWIIWAARYISLALLIIVGVVAFALYKIELLERKDHVDPGWVDVDFMRDVCRDENSPGCMHNHFINLSTVKPGILRRWTLWLFLRFVHLAGVVYFNKGKLGGIPSIHFARWVMLDQEEFGQPLLLFMTNYDASWDSYLGDFVDDASEGVSGIWSNTGGFPRTFGLILGGGSRNEKQFKAYARKGQLRSSAWFSAYPNLSVGHKLSNAALRRGLDQDKLDASAQDELLRRL